MLEDILNIGTILSTEKDAEKLYEIILKAAMDFTRSDAGTLYRLTDDKRLRFDIIHTRSKGMHLGGQSGQPIGAAPIELFLLDGVPDHSQVVSHAVHTQTTVHVEDVYASTHFDFSGVHAFDKQNDYQSRALLAIPLRTPEGEVIGALQLLNPLDEHGVLRSFTNEEQAVVRSLASQMAVALVNRKLIDTQAASFNSMTHLVNSAIDDRLERLMLEDILNIGTILSTEKDAEKLYEIILKAAMDFTHSDAGTLYRLTDDKQLRFDIIHTRSKGVHLGGKSGQPITAAPIELFLPDGTPDHSKIVSHAIHTYETVQVDDVYASSRFDFSGTHVFDKQNDYQSKSVLAVPLRTPDGEIIGALQLLNPLDERGAVRSFTKQEQAVVRSLASQMAVALANRILIDAQAALFDSMIQLINSAIDDKSPYTGGHCSRVPQLTLMMADAVNRCGYGPLANFQMTDEDRAELRVAGFLHDCGKISTPVHVVDKATKLEAIHDRIALVELRFELVLKEIEIALLKGELSPDLAQQKRQQAHEDIEFLKKSNTGSESMRDEHVLRIAQIAQHYGWVDAKGSAQAAVTSDEAQNLSIRYGTLNNEEREIINHHITLTINLLEQLPWPKHLRNVPEYAGGHHEKMDGKGYPKGLTREQMSVQARCMGIADIFEALTASDRPYKKAKSLSESLKIMGSMKLGQHIDPDLFDVFIWEKVYLQYAQAYLGAEQIDEVDVTQIPGYVAPPEGYVSTTA